MLLILRVTLIASLFLFAILPTIAQPELAILPSRSQAELATTPSSTQAEEKDWQFSVGVGVKYGSAYEGSDKYVATPLFDVSVRYKNGLLFANVWEGIGSYFIKDKNYKVGASIGIAPGRSEDDDNENLRGMGDIDIGVKANLMGEYSYGPFNISGIVSKGTGDYGTTATVKLGSRYRVSEQVLMTVSVGSTWADSSHMNTFYGVSSSQSLRSEYSRFEAESGLKSIGLVISTIYSLNNNWKLRLMVKGEQLIGDAADSPITKDDFTPSISLTTMYIF